jgi:hypothetical protein
MCLKFEKFDAGYYQVSEAFDDCDRSHLVGWIRFHSKKYGFFFESERFVALMPDVLKEISEKLFSLNKEADAKVCEA